MSTSVTLTNLQARARQRADKENSTFVGDTELTSYLNHSIRKVHAEVCKGPGRDHHATSATWSTTASTASYSFDTVTGGGGSDDVYQVLGVEAKLGGLTVYVPLDRFHWRNRNRDSTWGGWVRPRYAVVGRTIRFSPVPDAATDMQTWYITHPTPLSGGSDTYSSVMGWDEYVELDAAMQILAKEESDLSAMMLLRDEALRRVLANAEVDTSTPLQWRDAETEQDLDLWW
jgi:hypothetical protein